jgi:hypothetical protein
MSSERSPRARSNASVSRRASCLLEDQGLERHLLEFRVSGRCVVFAHVLPHGWHPSRAGALVFSPLAVR